MILIGSQAMKYHFLEFNREPSNWDYGYGEEVKQREKVITIWE